MADANQIITNAGFNINIVGDVSVEQSEIIVSQEPPAETVADTGSIITITIEEKKKDE